MSGSQTQTSDFVEELRWRGLLHQTTAGDELSALLKTPGQVAYCGFDPTRDSLTIGNYIGLKLLAHWQRCGHKPLVLVGGGTGLIGDPSGKDAERQLMTREQVQKNVDGMKRAVGRVLDMDPSNPNAAEIVDNADWLCDLKFIDVLRDVGKHFSVNAMIQKESVRERLNAREQGISYTEFSYMLLQAYDFLHLRREKDCVMQMAGSDQYGNIVVGIDLIRRHYSGQPESVPRGFGVTAPLVTAADGRKIGKTEKGAVWLTADRTSPYAFYQYWLNVPDADLDSFLRWFTFLDQPTIEALVAEHSEAPHKRIGQRRLAQEVTAIFHGQEEVTHVEAASSALFGGDIAGLSEEMLAEVFSEVPHSAHALAELDGEGLLLVDLLAETTLAKSKGEARRHLKSGALALNGKKVPADHAETQRVTSADLLHGSIVMLRRGKKNWHVTRWA